MIEHGVHGILLPDPEDELSFVAALGDLLLNPAKAAQLGENARQRVREKYLGVRHLIQYAQLIEALGN